MNRLSRTESSLHSSSHNTAAYDLGGSVNAADKAFDTLLYATIALALVGVIVADITLPLGIAVWIIYIIPVVLTYFAWKPQVPILAALCVTVLLITGYQVSPAGDFQNVALVNRSFGGMTVCIMAVAGYFFVTNKIAVRRQQWLQTGQTRLSETMAGELGEEQLGRNILRFLAEYLGAHAGAIFIQDGENYRRLSAYGVPGDGSTPEMIGPTEGLLAQAARDNRAFIVPDVPEGYLAVGSGLGRGVPRNLLIAPVRADLEVVGVLELGGLQRLNEVGLALVERVSESIGVALRSAQYRARLQTLLEETQQQAEELQVQSEELRTANEELEEQSRALGESQARLEQQQAELEQTNAQLEEQTQLLETQRDELSRAQTTLELKAYELERASRYKSEFLANMSHELRTPLNSSLIMAKLLADNPSGNLTAEQVRYAETMLAASNDLLALIDDILDLSKIEAGHMEMRPERINLEDLMADFERMIRPLAEAKSLEFNVQFERGYPAILYTDRQRLEQVLKNLLSNAIKFTDRGRVGITVSRDGEDGVAFAVRDTGIGIAEQQQQVIFDAFRQADGNTNRKYGGTGLGLSISRELSRLLGGEIRLNSELGKGSTFTVVLPAEYDPARAPLRAERGDGVPVASVADPWPVLRRSERGLVEATHDGNGATAVKAKAPEPARAARDGERIKSATARLLDDRDSLEDGKRLLLVVEDDETFGRILYDMARELGFQCLLANSAEEALATAKRYLPGAVILDLGLPDHSGLSVLDRLKQDVRTRHIPVHVVSASDYTQTALSLGAVGYMLKPVKREQLVQALQGLGARLEQHMRRVLLVEDDPTQLESMRALLDSHAVETLGARSAAECLQLLADSTFDCMVLDLTLPDASGFALLEKLSQDDAYSFPPVIVYTGRELTSDEEQKLRRYSRSIIIKGAKSPERLLDEVTLFLHQVVADLPPMQQRMLEQARSRDASLEGRRILVVEDDVRNVFALSSILERRGCIIQIARNGLEALQALQQAEDGTAEPVDLVLMDIMMPEMDGLTAMREIRKRPEWQKLPIIALTAKAMKDDQRQCLDAGANDYLAKPLNVEKLLSLVRVWMPR
jgi:CheY-like chemotaxis protein